MTQTSETGHFPLEKMFGDFMIAGFATLVGSGLLFGTSVATGWRIAFAAFLAAALWFLWRTWRLFRTKVILCPPVLIWWNISCGNLADLEKLHLRFYGSVRQRQNGGGTYQLTLRFRDGKRLQVDQRLTNFQELLEVASAANPACDDITKGYLGIHGIEL